MLCRTPLPINRLFHKSSGHRILVHVIQLFFRFLLGIQVKRIIFWLPERIGWRNFPGKLRSHATEHLLEFHAGSLFPAFHESAQLARLGKPYDQMYMVRHNHKPRTNAAILVKLLNKQFQQLIPQRFAVKHSSPVVARERHEVSMMFLVVYPSVGHAGIVSAGPTLSNLLCCAHRQSFEIDLLGGNVALERLSLPPDGSPESPAIFPSAVLRHRQQKTPALATPPRQTQAASRRY